MALSEWVRPIAYCEIDPYCQGVLLTNMFQGHLQQAPIWDDIRTLSVEKLALEAQKENWRKVDIVYGGFPCQDISVAGRGKGLEGKRSGLFFEIVRLAKEIKPKFLFLENVPAITSRGGLQVVREIAEMGYDCRWCVISAASVGALHRRERWFLLGYSKHHGSYGSQERGSSEATVYNITQGEDKASELKGTGASTMLASEFMANTESKQGGGVFLAKSQPDPINGCDRGIQADWWEVEPDVGRVVDGVQNRVDKLRALGNAVVPQQAKEAFKILMGL